MGGAGRACGGGLAGRVKEVAALHAARRFRSPVFVFLLSLFPSPPSVIDAALPPSHYSKEIYVQTPSSSCSFVSHPPKIGVLIIMVYIHAELMRR